MAVLKVSGKGYSYKMKEFPDVTVEFLKCSARQRLELVTEIQEMQGLSLLTGEFNENRKEPTASDLMKMMNGILQMTTLKGLTFEDVDGKEKPLTDPIEFFNFETDDSEIIEKIQASIFEMFGEATSYLSGNKKKLDRNGGADKNLAKPGGSPKTKRTS